GSATMSIGFQGIASRLLRPAGLAAGALLLGLALSPAAVAAPHAQITHWLESLWPEAQKLGVSRKTFTAAIHGLEPDLSLPDLDRPGKHGTRPEPGELITRQPAYLPE